MKKKLYLLTMLVTLIFTGCAKAAPVNTQSTEVEMEQSETRQAATEPSQQPQEESSAQWTDTAAQNAGSEAQIMESTGEVILDENGEVIQTRIKKATPEQIAAGKKALKTYFDITLDEKEFEIVSYFSEEEVYEGELFKANTSINFNALENRTSEGLKDGKYQVPEYTVSFYTDGEVKDIYIHGIDTVWEDAARPVTLEETKKLTREFLQEKKILGENEIELLGAAFASDISAAAAYKDGKDGAIVVTVDIATGKIDCFDRVSRERGIKWVSPIKAGSGVG